jgi:hypothetical protein
LFGFLISFISHNYLFRYLFDFQFNYDILLYSLDIRFIQYSFDNLDFDFVFSYLVEGLLLISLLILINFVFKIFSSKNQIFNFLIILIAICASFFATPHIANLFLGWFFFPSFFYVNNLKSVYTSSQ